MDESVNTLFEQMRESDPYARIAAVDAFIASSHSPSALDTFGMSALHCVIIHDDLGALCQLIDHGAEFQRPLLNRDEFNALLSNSKPPSVDHFVEDRQPGAIIDLKYSPLMWACFNRKPLSARLLIQRGADVSQANFNGETPLSLTLQTGNMELLLGLIASGADLHYTDLINGDNYLHLALRMEQFEAFKLFLDSGIDVTYLNDRGFTVTQLCHHLQLTRPGLARFSDVLFAYQEQSLLTAHLKTRPSSHTDSSNPLGNNASTTPPKRL